MIEKDNAVSTITHTRSEVGKTLLHHKREGDPTRESMNDQFRDALNSDQSRSRMLLGALRQPRIGLLFLLDYVRLERKLKNLAGESVKDYLKEACSIYERVRNYLLAEKVPLSSTLRPWAIPTVYAMIRARKPSCVVETGVASGVSSTFILEALERNQKGALYSIDFPIPSLLPPTKSTGWLVPERLKHRWDLILGRSQDRLSPLLEGLHSVDTFLHDSEHSYSNMYYELTVAWKYISIGGIIICDDWWQNKAFTDFANKVGCKWDHIARFAFLLKSF